MENKLPSDSDRRLHALSLMVAAEYQAEHRSGPIRNDNKCEDLLMAFRCIRRHINAVDDGCRFGAHSAYLAMQGRAE